MRIWKQTVALAGTLAERTYLSNRKLKLPSYVEDVRFHPSCPFGKERLPCMVALYRDIVSNEPRAIHRTALMSDGHKIDRKALGPKGGCAIKLTPDAEVSTGLTIAEGIETALAGMALAFCPAWALGDAGSIERFPVLSGIECLTILADNDPTGQNAAIECSSRWTAEGREVFRVSSVRATRTSQTFGARGQHDGGCNQDRARRTEGGTGCTDRDNRRSPVARIFR